MTDTTMPIAPPAERPDGGIPEPLHARPEESPMVRRAGAAAATVAGFEGCGRLDSRFRHAVGDLARAISGLEGMRACGFAPEVAEEALPRLAEVLSAVERALERARPELEAERRSREGGGRPAPRRPRAPRSGPPSG